MHPSPANWPQKTCSHSPLISRRKKTSKSHKWFCDFEETCVVFFPWEQKTYSNLKWKCWRIPNIWENPIVLVKLAFVIVYLCNLSGSTWKHMLKLVLFHRSVCVVILSWYVNSYVYIVTIYIHYNCNIIVYIYIYI